MLPQATVFTSSGSFACFDTVVCSQILLFIKPEEWKVSKPFLISKTFYSVSNSETFARDYLCEYFNLLEEEEKKLEELIYNPPIFRESLLNGAVGEKRKRDETTFDKKKKNIKHSGEGTLDLSNPPTSFQQVFQWYLQLNDSNLYQKSKEKLSNLIDDIYSADFQFDNLYQILDRMKAKRFINSNFGYFLEGSYIITEELGKTEISKDEIELIFTSGSRDEFILEWKLDKSMEGHIHYKVKCLIFTNCGYPLVVEGEYQRNIDTLRGISNASESLTVYGQEVFGGFMFSSATGYMDSNEERINVPAVELLSEILGNDFEKNLKEIGILSEERTIVRYQLIYNYLQCTLGEHEKSFLASNEQWIPFAKFKGETTDSDEEDNSI